MSNPTAEASTANSTALPSSPPGAPRWARVFGAGLLALILLVGAMFAHHALSGHGSFDHHMSIGANDTHRP